jgi:hypothetical protein
MAAAAWHCMALHGTAWRCTVGHCMAAWRAGFLSRHAAPPFVAGCQTSAGTYGGVTGAVWEALRSRVTPYTAHWIESLYNQILQTIG